MKKYIVKRADTLYGYCMYWRNDEQWSYKQSEATLFTPQERKRQPLPLYHNCKWVRLVPRKAKEQPKVIEMDSQQRIECPSTQATDVQGRRDAS